MLAACALSVSTAWMFANDTSSSHPYQTAMPRDDFDGASITTQQSTFSIASAFSSIWSKVPSSRRKINLSLDDLCSYLRTTTDVEHSPIEELIVRKEEDGVQHEFLLILLYGVPREEEACLWAHFISSYLTAWK